MDWKRIERLTASNAAGTARTLEQVKKLAQGANKRIKVGTYTRKRRSGNISIPGGRVYYYDTETHSSYNSLGMPNVGSRELRTLLPEMVQIVHEAGKELWVSIAGESAKEFSKLALICFSCGVDGVELNLGCPNVHDKGVSKPIFSYHPEMVGEILTYMEGQFYGENRQISVKISPVPDEVLVALVHVINQCEIVTEVTATNTLPNQEALDEIGNPALSFVPPGGNEVLHKGGRAGALLKADSLRVVRLLRSHDPKAKGTLHTNTKLTVVGGISSGADLMEYFVAANGEIDGFEVGTAYIENENPKIYSDIMNEFVSLLEVV